MVSLTAQTSQAPSQALLQQTPSAQKRLAQSVAAAQAVPSGCWPTISVATSRSSPRQLALAIAKSNMQGPRATTWLWYLGF